MPSDTTVKGELACLKLEQRAIEKKAIVSRPTLECEYDRIVDCNGQLYKVQVKYSDSDAPNSSGAIQVTVGKADTKTGHHKPYDESDIDAIVVYVARVDTLCWFDKKEWLGKTKLSVRYEPTKNNQSKGCRMMNDFTW